MRRREFIGSAGQAAVGVGLLPFLTSCRQSTPALRPRFWTWVHGDRPWAEDEWRRRFARLRGAGLEAVLVSGGDSRLLSGAARAEGLEFHRWMWTLNRTGDAWVKENHPEWFTVSRHGESSLTTPPYVGYYQWLCPTRPAVRDYLRKAVHELALDPDIDGVHLDYVRHCDVILPVGLWEKYDLVQDREHPEFDFCYCTVCRETFRQQGGHDPLELDDPTADAAWREFRWASVSGVVEALAETVHKAEKPITAAVFPTPSLARKLVRQAWEIWPVDAVFPMLYHSFYDEEPAWIAASAREGLDSLPPERSLHGGLYLPSLEPTALGEAVRALREEGAGIALFEMEGITDEHLAALRSSLA